MAIMSKEAAQQQQQQQTPQPPRKGPRDTTTLTPAVSGSFASLSTAAEDDEGKTTTLSSRASDASSRSGSTSSTPVPLTAVPLLGFGTFNEFKDDDKVGQAVEAALREGYRMLDCAALYGNERQVGAAVKRCLDDEDLQLDRDDLFVCGKLWCWDAAPEDVEAACRRSLEDLGLEYLDNYMLHWPVRMSKESRLVSKEFGGKFEYQLVHDGSDVENIMETYRAMEHLVEVGLVRSLGVSNVGLRTLSAILEHCSIKPTILEVEMHPYLAQPRLLAAAQDAGVHVVAYSPLGKVGYRDPGHPSLLEESEVLAVAEEAGRSPGQVLLRWGVQRGASVIPKSLNPDRIRANRDVLDWQLTREQMARLDALDRGFRFCKPDWCDLEKDSEYCIDAGHPACQPHRTPCTVDENGGFHNKFERTGKLLSTEILVQRGIMADLASLGKTILPECSHSASNYLVTDEVVDELYGDQVLNGLRAAGLDVHKIVVPAASMDEAGEPSGEPFKNGSTFNKCVDTILERGISKHTCIVSLGGGVVNNLCGVIAATLYRGIKLVHFTTTSMGMLDAAIDFKQAFNHRCGKNLIGAYYPADIVVMDPDALTSLTDRHILNGIAEALKHGLTQSMDLVRAIVEPLRNAEDPRAALREGSYLEELCKETIEVKVPTLTHYDESDFNEMVPQFGHCIAHSIEHISWNEGHSPLLHGEAVAIGMCVTAEVARIMGICEDSVVDQHYDFVGATGLPVFVPETMQVEDIMEAMTYDKHYVKNPVMGLCKEIGVMATTEDGSYAFTIEQDVIKQALQRNTERRTAA